MPHPTRLPALLALLPVVVLGAGCGGREGPASHPPVATPASAARGAEADTLAVLHDWDARRLRAWRRADARALGRLYGPGSATGRADVRLLREYADHGLVVRDLHTQVFAVRVLAARRSGAAARHRPDRRRHGRARRPPGRPAGHPARRPRRRPAPPDPHRAVAGAGDDPVGRPR